MTQHHPCPRCREPMRVEATRCPRCHHDLSVEERRRRDIFADARWAILTAGVMLIVYLVS